MIYLFLADGFEEIEALSPLDVLKRCGATVCTVGVTGKTVKGSHGVEVVCDKTASELDEKDDFDMIILPGGMPGALNLDKDETVDKFITLASKRDKFICAICAAPFVLGKRGILKGKRAVCYPGFEDQLLGATLEDRGVVRDGKIITGRAMGSALDFAFELAKALFGEETAEKVRKGILY